MRIDARQFLYLSLARKLLRRPRPSVWINLVRFKRAMAHGGGRKPDRVAYTPVDVVLWATTRCNKTCHFCHYAGALGPADGPGGDLSLGRLDELLDHRLVRNALRICLYGGEPLLNPDVFRMTRAARARGHLVSLSTNGLLLEERSAELQADPPDMLAVSYYPADRDRLISGLERVPRGTAVRLAFLLTRSTLPEVPRVLDLAIEQGVHTVCFERMCPHGSTSGELSVGNGDLPAIRAQMTARFGRRVHMVWPRSEKESRRPCRYFWSSAFVDVHGRLSPCCAWPMRSFEESLFDSPDAWNGPRMQACRRALHEGRPPVECADCPFLDDDPLAL